MNATMYTLLSSYKGPHTPAVLPGYRSMNHSCRHSSWLSEKSSCTNILLALRIIGAHGYCVKVLVKCRQNVANKLFITRVFNPVRPHTWLTALSALLRLLNALICPKEVEASSFSLWGTESTYNKLTVVVDFGPAGSVGCVARVSSKTWLW